VIRQAWIYPPLTTLPPFTERIFHIFSVPVFFLLNAACLSLAQGGLRRELIENQG
jgi:hypothetical protein